MATVNHIGYFPWCIYENFELVRQDYSYLSEEQWEKLLFYFNNFPSNILGAMGLYWRVKSWKISGIQTTAERKNFDEYEYYPIDFEFLFVRNAEKETDLICKQFYENDTVSPIPLAAQTSFEGDPLYGSFVYEDPIGSQTRTAVCSFQIPWVGASLFSGTTDDKPMGGHFQDDIIYTHSFFSFDGDETGDILFTPSASFTQSDGSVEAQGQLSFLGTNINFSYWRTDPLEENIELPIENLLIEAAEYWPYDPLDGGGPIYDSITGEQIRDFP
jgi:hypothetical protein